MQNPALRIRLAVAAVGLAVASPAFAQEMPRTSMDEPAAPAPEAVSGAGIAAEPGESPDETPAAPRPRHRAVRDRFGGTLALGLSVGGGSPLGAGGVFLEYRPWSFVAAQVGGGFGGTFGPAIGATLFVDPIVTRAFVLGVGVAASHNYSIITTIPGVPVPPLPSSTDWVSVEVAAEGRPMRGVFIRAAVGRGFLLNVQAFRVASEEQLNTVPLPDILFADPLDAVRAAARSESFAVWYAHLDVALYWRL